MEHRTVTRPKGIGPTELDVVLDRARAEGWRSLALIGPYATVGRVHDVPDTQVFHLSEPLGARISRLSRLNELTALALPGHQLRDMDARQLAVAGVEHEL